jgi:ribulose-phosphate 3-epimerase
LSSSVWARPRPELAVSILAADQTALGTAVAQAEKGGATAIHVDVMDGHFVSNLAYGPDTVRDLRRHSHLYIDVHLMVADPDPLLARFAAAGADNITVHVEACPHPIETLQRIHALRPGLSAGLALNPETSVASIEPDLPYVDRVMLMSVHPGFGGQHFEPEAVTRLDELKAMVARQPRLIRLEMDGGIGPDNVTLLVQHGLDVAVAGSAVFLAPDVTAATRRLVDLMAIP